MSANEPVPESPVGLDALKAFGSDEHDTLEFKKDLSNRDAVRKAICALANDLPAVGGGVLLIGVRNDGQPAHMVVDDRALLDVVNFRDEARIVPRPVMRVQRARFRGADVIAVEVDRL
jgi:ATP-dependent DNA helicase RecG